MSNRTHLFVATTILGLLGGQAALAVDPPLMVGNFRPQAQDAIVPADAKLELLWGEGEFTEGPAAAPDGTIYFSDIGNRILRYHPANGQVDVARDPSGRANGLMFDVQGRLLACEGAWAGNRRISITKTDGTVRTLADRYDGRRFNSPNDLAIAPNGDVYFTDPRYVGDEPRELDFEGVFLIRPNGEVKLATRACEKPNGILVAADGKRAFVADHNSAPRGKRQLLAFDVADDGALTAPKVLYDFTLGRGIDGMTLDVEGNIYATAGAGDQGGIYVFHPEGRPLAFIKTPGDPTNCVFGRGDDARTLYITTQNAPPEKPGQPRRYGLYRVGLKKAGYHLPADK